MVFSDLCEAVPKAQKDWCRHETRHEPAHELWWPCVRHELRAVTFSLFYAQPGVIQDANHDQDNGSYKCVGHMLARLDQPVS